MVFTDQKALHLLCHKRLLQKISCFFVLAFTALPCFSAYAQTQADYDAAYGNHYLALPATSAASSRTATLPSGTVYSPNEYPTAQGQYLKLPPQQAVPYVRPQPVITSVAVAPIATVPTVSVSPVSQAAPVPVSTNIQPPAMPQNYNGMPSYTYNTNSNPSYVPYKTPLAHDPKAVGEGGMPMGTISGVELGVQISDYRYQEFGPDGQELIRITGPTGGITLSGVKSSFTGWFVGGDLRVSYGLHKYTGGDEIISGPQAGTIIPSTKSDLSDWMFDARFTGGHDFIFQDSFWGLTDVGLSPYAGLGFRYLYDDNKGTDSNGVEGYERYSHYFYLPVGLTPRFRLNENSRLSLNMEYDLLLYGWQVSSLGEPNPGDSDLTNTQKTGYGLRGNIMYERHSWALGPFFEFWDIGQSSTDCSTLSCGFEPHSQTIEYGVQGKYRF